MQTLLNVSKKVQRGFTLLELLIVIAILAILAAVVIIVLNPAQTLAQARDSQRLSDLATMKSAISLYMTTVNPVDLDGGAGALAGCLGDNHTDANIYYSYPQANAVSACVGVLTPGAGADIGSGFDAAAGDFCMSIASPTHALVDGTGWIPVDFTDITGGSPLSNLPVDPTNTLLDATPTSADFLYRYICQQGGVDGTKPTPAFELAATLESTKYAGASPNQDMDANDGGDNTAYYEVGTTLTIGPTEATY